MKDGLLGKHKVMKRMTNVKYRRFIYLVSLCMENAWIEEEHTFIYLEWIKISILYPQKTYNYNFNVFYTSSFPIFEELKWGNFNIFFLVNLDAPSFRPWMSYKPFLSVILRTDHVQMVTINPEYANKYPRIKLTNPFFLQTTWLHSTFCSTSSSSII